MASIESCPASSSRDPRLAELNSKFESLYGERAEVVVRVPGRVNLIGEHVDYCGYDVLPMAIEQDILVAVNKQEAGLDLHNVDPKYEPHLEASTGGLEVPHGQPHWWAYFLCGIKGLVEELGLMEPRGMKCLASGCIPPSAGLSSSSAVVVSAALATVWANDVKIDREALAALCARAERFIGTQGGGMDQAIELLAIPGTAKLIQFNPLVTHDVTLPHGATFVVANSLSEKNKAKTNDYNTRVVECRLATKIMAKKLLKQEQWRTVEKLVELQVKLGKGLPAMEAVVRSVLHEADYSKAEVATELGEDEKFLDNYVLTENTRDVANFRLYQRAMHVFTEAARVHTFRDICDKGGESALSKLGHLMADSHTSCSQLYQCSAPGLDRLVELSVKHEALGARLTGAGWGGCIVALVPQDKVVNFVDNIKEEYYRDLEAAPGQDLNTFIFPTLPGAGASIWHF